MNCPTCGLDDMELIDVSEWYCQSCGTLVDCDGVNDPCVPKLVTRCRALAEAASPALMAELRRLGIIETIYPPMNRPGEEEPC